ncbi:MAG: hypothetical protein LUD72_06965 [Bacteroidales bacterium]|nr:hypothetical protein [Bacteroidales bacterium]
MNGNYIKIDRGILDWEWYRNENTLRLFIHCLLKANWKDGRFEGVDIPRGSFATSISTLSNELNISYQSTRTSLNHLKSTGELTVTAFSKFSVITVNNYALYQDANRQTNKQLTGNQQATNRQLTGDQQATNNNRRKKEYKEREEGKKGIKKESFYPNDEKLDEAFRDFFEMRKTIKAPMTDRAVTHAQNKLAKLAQLPFSDQMDNDLAIEILNQSTMNSWKGLFPLKKQNEGNTLDEWRNAL